MTRAGRALFEHVYAYWSARPAAQRPRLLVYGESLGSLGSEAAFNGLSDVLGRTDGISTQVLSGKIAVGDTVLTDIKSQIVRPTTQ